MKQAAWWKENLHPERIRSRASRQTYERGEQYQQAQRVLSLQFTDGELIARVQGTEVYDVRFWRRGKELQTDCTCVFAREGAFCKHAVAVALTIHANLTADD